MRHWPVISMAGLLASASVLAAETSDLPYTVVHSGQNRCYDDRRDIPCPPPGQAFYGQDAQTIRHPARYVENGDGTVSDLTSGLMWQVSFDRATWNDAPQRAAASRVGGYADWRVPSIKELYSLMMFSGSTGSARPETTGAPSDARPYISTPPFQFEYPSQGRFIDAQYISSTAYGGLTMGRDRSFFGVNFADGRIKAYPQDGGPGRRQWYVRYVRGNGNYGGNIFTDLGNGVIHDGATGLDWTKNDSQRGLDWQQALAYCQGLQAGGHDDWRLPSAKELHSIVDYRRSPDATGSAAIDPIFAISPHNNGLGQMDWPNFWTSTTHLDGPRQGDFAVYVAFGRAMGNVRQGGPGQDRMGIGGGGSPPNMPPGRGGFGPPPGGGPMGPPPGGGEMGRGQTTLLDVHGAGAQRSSPKSGDESRLPVGAGPQGDVLKIYNHARCVRG